MSISDLNYDLLLRIGLYFCIGMLFAEGVTNLQRRRYNANPPKAWYLLYLGLWPLGLIIGVFAFIHGALKAMGR